MKTSLQINNKSSKQYFAQLPFGPSKKLSWQASPSTREIESVINSASIKISAAQQKRRLAPLLKLQTEVEKLYLNSSEAGLRDYADAPASVKRFYRNQRRGVTAEMTLKDRKAFLPLRKGKLSMWGLIQRARKYADGSDPDHIKAQLLHLYGAAKKAQDKKMPDWFVLTCLIHDGGKFLMEWIPEHRVVGDTFPHLVRPGAEEIFFSEFKYNSDWKIVNAKGKSGFYKPKCGLDEMLMTWGHDEYLFHMVFNWLKENAEFVKKSWKCSALEIRLMLYMIRFHSFYAFHRQGGYRQLWSKTDAKLRPYLRIFSMFDLYSKPDRLPAIKVLDKEFKPLVNKFFPAQKPVRY